MAIGRWGRGAFVCVAAVAAGAWAGPAKAQVVTVTVKSAGDLLKQFRTLAGVADPASAKQMLDGLDALENGGMLKWLDRSRPLAGTVDLPGGGPPVSTMFLPVTGRDDFLDALKGFGFAVDDKPGAEGFSHRVARPGGEGPAYFLLADPPAGYAVLHSEPSGAAKVRAINPASLRPARPGTVLVGARLDRVPEPLKSAFLANVKQRNDVARQRKVGETDEQYQGRVAGIALAEEGFTRLVRDGREVTLDAGVGEKSDTVTLALGVDANPGTAMAKSLGSFGTRRGKFLNLWPAAAATVQGVIPVPEAFRTLIRKSIDQQRAKVEKEGAPDDRRVIGLMLDALSPTLTGDSFDACMAMGAQAAPGKGDTQGGTNVVLFGVGMKDSTKVEAALREAIARKLKPEDKAKVALDHARGPDGTAIHRVMLDPNQLKNDEFGEPLMFLAFPEGAALAAVGGNGLAVMKQSLSALKKSGAGAAPGPQVGFDFAAVRFSRLHTGENEAAFRDAAKDVFRGKEAAKDHIHIGLTGEAARVRLLLEADLPVVRFLVQVGVIQQKARAGR